MNRKRFNSPQGTAESFNSIPERRVERLEKEEKEFSRTSSGKLDVKGKCRYFIGSRIGAAMAVFQQFWRKRNDVQKN